jgi:hypothetical protein
MIEGKLKTNVTFNNCIFQFGDAASMGASSAFLKPGVLESEVTRPSLLSNPHPRLPLITNRGQNHQRARPRRPRRVLQQQNKGKAWPIWLAPLDFEQVDEAEAVARINAAGYFMHAATGRIYLEGEGGTVIRQSNGNFRNILAGRFARHHDGKVKPASDAWRNSRQRREFREIGYWPEQHGQPTRSFNLWRRWGAEPRPGDWSIVHDHILNVVATGDKAKAEYILNWCAHMVQRPWEKPGVALVLRGRKGSGKTLLTEILAAAVGRQNTFITADGRKLFARFNWHLADKILIGAEEAFFSADREISDKLKHLLTGTAIEVEQKFGDRMNIKSVHRMIMTTNHRDAIALTEDERRFAIFDVSDRRKGDDAYFAPLWRVANGEDSESLAAFMHELKTRDITNWRPQQVARDSASLHTARRTIVELLAQRAITGMPRKIA